MIQNSTKTGAPSPLFFYCIFFCLVLLFALSFLFSFFSLVGRKLNLHYNSSTFFFLFLLFFSLSFFSFFLSISSSSSSSVLLQLLVQAVFSFSSFSTSPLLSFYFFQLGRNRGRVSFPFFKKKNWTETKLSFLLPLFLLLSFSFFLSLPPFFFLFSYYSSLLSCYCCWTEIGGLTGRTAVIPFSWS